WEVRGSIRPLKKDLFHFPFKDIQDQVHTNLRYSRLGANVLKKKSMRPSVLKLIVKPIGKFLETYLLKSGFRDGIAGFIISVNAAHSIFLKYAYLFEERRQNHERSHRG